MDFEPMGKLRQKVLDLKHQRDLLNKEVAIEKSEITSIEAEIAKFKSVLEKKLQTVAEKDKKIQRYNKIIGESEMAVKKLVENSLKLESVIDKELDTFS